MKSGLTLVSLPMADPPQPQPTPFPIRIVTDPPSNSDSVTQAGGDDDSAPAKKSDHFYQAWDKFLAIEPRRAKTASTPARKLAEEKRKLGPSGTLRVEENAATSWETAAEQCKAKVAAIVDECTRLNQKYRDVLFDLEASPYCLQSLVGKYPKAVEKNPPPWIKRVEDIFDDPQFFVDGAAATDVHQGSSGDCWFLAALMAVSAKKELIDKLCVAREPSVGVYGFVFYRDGGWIYEVIDDKLFLRVGDDDDLSVVRDWNKENKEGVFVWTEEEKLKLTLQRGGEALYFSHCKSNETWVPLIEKAYAKAHGDYSAIEGGFPSEAIEDITGGVGAVINPENIMDKDRFWREQLSQVNKKYLFGGGSKSCATKGFVGSHAYAVLEAWEEGDLRLLKLRNPWGETEWEGDWSDGSKLWTPKMMEALNHTFGDDGIFWISYQDFLKHFPSINRVRLFDENWQVAQLWTSVNVPWTVDYLDTKFQFTITSKTSVVIVLNQPDDRYFLGLRGRYLFSMHFRVYKEGSEDERWLVRSMHNSGNETLFTRSVSAEIEDLEPGTYNVVFKVTATRTQQPTAEEAILKYAISRKEKLLYVGRRFDTAQTKGNLRQLEEANQKRARLESVAKRTASLKRARKLNQQEQVLSRKRKSRAQEANHKLRKAHREEVKVWKKAREERKKEEKAAKAKAESSEERSESGRATPGTEETAKSETKPEEVPKDDREVAVDEPAAVAGAETQDATAPTSNEGSSAPKAEEETTAPTSSEGSLVPKATEDTTQPVPADENFASTDHPKTQESAEESDPLAASLAKLVVAGDSATREDEVSVSPATTASSKTGRDETAKSEGESSDTESECSIFAPAELDDNDFDWDPAIDVPVYSDDSAYDSTSDDEEDGPSAAPGGDGASSEIFGGDPWNAMVVLGLRVYSFKADAKIAVVKGPNDS